MHPHLRSVGLALTYVLLAFHTNGSPALFRALRTQADIMDGITASAPNDRCSGNRSLWSFFTPSPSYKPPVFETCPPVGITEGRQHGCAGPGCELLGRESFLLTWIHQGIVLGAHIFLCCGHCNA